MVDFSTHKSGSVLDLVLTEYPNLINNIQDAGYLGKSDHKILYFDVVINPEIKESTKKVDDWSNADIVNIKKELSETNWIAASETLTLEDFWNFFVNCIDNVKSKYIPKKFLKKQSKPPWLSKEIEKLSKLKKRKWRRFRISKLSTHYEDLQICKIMESIIKDNLVQYLEENNLITNSQHGFRQKRSCLTNLLEYVEKLTKAIDSGQDLDMIYLDFSKAFDKVPIKRLLVKIKAIGVNEKTCQWIEDWLLNRKQRVIINGKASDWISVMSGVPQGSVLGPLLFVIFINDIDRAVNSSQAILSKFADDTKCGNVILNEQSCETLQNDINNLLDWADKWQMQFNADKCKVLHFGRNNPRHSYYMNGYAPAGTILCNDDHEKDVGVYISTTLKPSLNCQNAANKANSVLGQMSRSVTYRDRITWIKLYKQYVRPHLEYCVQAWSPWLEHDKKILEQVQERAVRMVSGLKGKTYEERLKELNLSSLEDRRKRGDMIQVWKIINKHDNLPANQFFEFFQEGRQTTRLSANYQNIVKPRFKTGARKYSFSVRVVDAWNSLPTSVKSAKTLNSFKSLYDKCIVN